MTENIAVYNDSSTLRIEDVLENVLGRYGADVIPLSCLSFDWTRIENLITLSLKDFEQWVPRLRWYVAPMAREFKMPDDCQEVRAVVLNVQGIIDTDMPVLYAGRDYTYNKYQNTVNSYLTNLKVQYLGTYLRTDTTTTTNEEYVVKSVETTFKIKYVPKPGTISIIYNNKTEELQATKVTPDSQSYKFSKGTVDIDLASMLVTVKASVSGNVQLAYTLKYKAIAGLTQGAEFFEALVAEKILTSIGNIKAVTNFASMPVNITADSLATLGQSIHGEVEAYKQNTGRQKWWLGITAIS